MSETSVYRATWKGQNKLCQDSWSAPGYTKSRCETFNYQIGLSAKEKLHGFGSKLKDLSEFALLRRINHFCREARTHILSFSNRTLCSLWGTSLYSTKPTDVLQSWLCVFIGTLFESFAIFIIPNSVFKLNNAFLNKILNHF